MNLQDGSGQLDSSDLELEDVVSDESSFYGRI